MRILTPYEKEGLEKAIKELFLVRGSEHERLVITIEQNTAEAWQNIFQIALKADEEMTREWHKAGVYPTWLQV